MEIGSSSALRDDQGNVITNNPLAEAKPVLWGDIVETSDSGAGSSSSDSGVGSDIETDLPHLDIDYSNLSGSPLFDCQCFNFDGLATAIGCINRMAEIDVNVETLGCMCDNIIRVYNSVFTSTLDPYSPERVAFTHYFYKLRHELLFKMLCKSFNLPVEHSDTPFSNFGVDSNRTPDLIIKSNEGTLVIIEVSATSSLEKAAISKGMEQMGFEGKYQKEIDELNHLGVSNSYCPVFFNMSNLSMPIIIEQIDVLKNFFHFNKTMYLNLVTLSKNLAAITQEMRGSLLLSSTILFTKIEDITLDHLGHNFLYSTVDSPDCSLKGKAIMNSDIRKGIKYNEFKVSSVVYNKVINNMHRLNYIIDQCKFTDLVNCTFILDVNDNKIKLIQDPNGLTLPKLKELIINNDIITLFKNFKLKVSGGLRSVMDSETGVKFIEKTSNYRPGGSQINEVNLILNHKPSLWSTSEISIEAFISKVEKYKCQEVYCNYFDPDYEDKIIKAMTNYDRQEGFNYSPISLNNKFLGCSQTEELDVKNLMLDIRDKYIQTNMENDIMPLVKHKIKTPFILPLAEINQSSYCKLDFKNEDFIRDILSLISVDNQYTIKILTSVLKPDYKMYTENKLASSSLQDLYNKRSRVSNSINMLQRSYYKTTQGKGKLSESVGECKEEFSKLKIEYKAIQKEITFRSKEENVGKNISYIRLPTKSKKSYLHSEFKHEMSHFKDKRVQSTIEGVGIRTTPEGDLKFDYNVFSNINSMLVQRSGKNPDDLYHDYVSDDVRLLKDLKKIALDSYRSLMNQIKDSYLGHASAFVSRLAHSLMFLSQLPFSSDYVRVDNLGYKNVLLVVKGGKKIFKSKSSKLYRLIYPISDCVLPWYNSPKMRSGSFQLIKIKNTHYIITPWQLMHESILTDAISFYPRVCSFVALNSSPDVPLIDQYNRLSLNVLLAFHNRRQTEVLLANMRYILLSTLGDFTGVGEILGEFFGFNYDCFQAFVRSSILVNYENYYKTILNLKSNNKLNKDLTEQMLTASSLSNIFTGLSINNSEDLALMIYSTFLMTKAPYQRAVERSTNLKSILKIHSEYDSTVGLKLNPQEQFNKLSVTLCDDNDFTNYVNKLFSNDFNIDPKYCANLGHFMQSYFDNEEVGDIFHSEWIKILSQTWDELSTSTGLRGDYEKIEDFWGKKGYFVVYKDLLSNQEFRSNLSCLMSSGIRDNDKRRLLRDVNITYKEKLSPSREFLIFHAVDKIQWRGSREIYVMDIMTKSIQQPIEKFLGFVCSKIDNELISIPSDRRAQVIHHSIFEKDLPLKDTLTWYLTLDCTKWAPKSVFSKFALCLNNMECIPNSFKLHFMNYMEKLYKKRVYFNISEVEVLKNNIKYKDVCNKYLKMDESVKGYYLEMPYSWVMGIFNYTSSFLHAANQKYFSYILSKTTAISYQEECSMVMFAHSDDSGGKLVVSSKDMARRALVFYEVSLKCANHLLSKKKSTVSRIYFEILSIIYLFKKLLALLPKFLGGLRFLPTDKGPSQDLLQSYSKCIEVLVAGADFNTAYLVLKIASYMVYRFYFNKSPSKLDYNRPVQYLGMPDSHPIMALVCGSDSDILRIMRTDKGKSSLINLISFSNIMSNSISSEGPIKPFKFLINVRGLNKGFEVALSEYKNHLDSWSIRNVNYHNTAFNTLNFLSKLNDPGFVGSLVNESTTRRVSRSYFIRSGYSAVTRFGLFKLSEMMDAINLFQSYTDGNMAVNHLLSGVLNGEELESLNNEMQDSIVYSTKQFKVLEHTLLSPIKMMVYMDNLGAEGRDIVTTQRTLKPTQVQLSKGGKIFSVDFEPASLISYVKEPNLRWALNSVRNLSVAAEELINFVTNIGYKVEDLSEDTLLRLCRSFSRDNTRYIYLYSRVPGDIRQIKSYTSFLTFLSVNTFNNKEIRGLTLKLNDGDLSREYLTTNIDEVFYTINNIISILIVVIKKCDISFIESMRLNPLPHLGFEGGSISDLIMKIKGYIDIEAEGCVLSSQVGIISAILSESETINASVMEQGCFYTFLKSQRLRQGWYGTGEVYIKVDKNFYSFEIKGSEVISVLTDRIGKLPNYHEKYILDVWESIGVSMPRLKYKCYKFNELTFGIDIKGDMAVLPYREINRGIPAREAGRRIGFINNMSYYDITTVYKDHAIIVSNIEGLVETRKVYFLPLKKAELMPLINIMFNPEDFSTKLATMGLNDFESFVHTELLTEYGSDLTIGFDEFIDNYNSSKIYEIFSKSSKNSWAKIPRKIIKSLIPAPEGSLTKILIDYTANSKDPVLKTPVHLDNNIMKLRSEYPEMMPVILNENMVKCYDNIYGVEERKEITDAYMSLTESDDLGKSREALIKLMEFWGYSSLISNIQGFKLFKSPNNYKYFNLNLNEEPYRKFYCNLYPDLVKILGQTMENFQNEYEPENTPHRRLAKLQPPMNSIREYIISSCLSLYNEMSTPSQGNINECILHNMIISFFQNDGFIAELQLSLNSLSLLSSIEISHRSRYEFLCLMNTLKFIWVKSNSQKFKLNFAQKLQRLEDDKIMVNNFTKSFGIKLNPSAVYYSTAINDKIYSLLNNRYQLDCGNKTYKIELKLIQNLPNFHAPVNDCILFKRPLNEKLEDHDDWEDFTYELNMADIDEDTVADYWSGFENKYKKKKTKKFVGKTKTTVRGEVKVYIKMSSVIGVGVLGKLRQAAENFILLTDLILKNFTKYLPNSGVYLINFGKPFNDSPKYMLAYYSFQKEINGSELLNKLFPGESITISDFDEELLCVGYVLDNDLKVKQINRIGDVFSGVQLSEGFKYSKTEEGGMISVFEDGEDKTSEERETEVDEITKAAKEYNDSINKIEALLEEVKSEESLSEKTLDKLKKKYTDENLVIPTNKAVLFKSLIKESEMLKMSEGIKTGAVQLTDSQHRKMMLAPTYFGVAQNLNRRDKNPIRDKKVKCEINTLHGDLAALVGSSNLKVSDKYRKVLLAHYKGWLQNVKHSKYKKENKNFLLTLFVALINSAAPTVDNNDDNMWHEIIDKIVLYITDDGPDSEEEEEDLLDLLADIQSSSRILYRAMGT